MLWQFLPQCSRLSSVINCNYIFSDSLRCHCGKIYRSKNGLKIHQRKHSLKFPFRCQYCAKGFSLRRKLEEHLTRHTGLPVAVCKICGFKAMSYYGLQGHMNRHIEKTFKCEICNKTYYTQHILNRHFKMHEVV